MCGRQTGSYPETGFEEVVQIGNGKSASLWRLVGHCWRVYQGLASPVNVVSATRDARSEALQQGGFDLPSDASVAHGREHQLAAGVAQFELSVRLPHIVEGEDSGDQGSGCTVVLNKYGS